MPEPMQQFVLLTQHGTCPQWLKGLGKQVSSVADWMEEQQQVERSQVERLLKTTENLDKARIQISSLEEELARAKEFGVLMSKMGQSTKSITEPVEWATLQKKAPEAEPVARTSLENDVEREQELQTFKEELAAQEALIERERDKRKIS